VLSLWSRSPAACGQWIARSDGRQRAIVGVGAVACSLCRCCVIDR
jgi:hypothetical protein